MFTAGTSEIRKAGYRIFCDRVASGYREDRGLQDVCGGPRGGQAEYQSSTTPVKVLLVYNSVPTGLSATHLHHAGWLPWIPLGPLPDCTLQGIR